MYIRKMGGENQVGGEGPIRFRLNKQSERAGGGWTYEGEGGGSGNRGEEEGDGGVVRLTEPANLGSWATGVHAACARVPEGGRWCAWAGHAKREPVQCGCGRWVQAGLRVSVQVGVGDMLESMGGIEIWVDGWLRDGGFQWAPSGLVGGRAILQRALIAA